MKIPVRLFLSVTFALFTLTACQTTPVQADQPDQMEAVVTYAEFITPPSEKVLSTADSIVVKGFRTKFIKGHLKADFKLFNDRGRRNVINYRVQWLDKDGLMASPYGPWLTVALEGQQELVVTVMSPVRRAVDFRLELQTN